jgi:HlyD family secretion protein
MARIRIRWAVPVLVLAAAAFWGTTRIGGEAAGLPPLNTVTAERGDVSQRVVAHGTLQPQHTVLVGSQVSGIIEEIHADFNSRVRQGQVIARIDRSTFAAAVSAAEAELAAAHANFEFATLHWRRVQELHEHQISTPSEMEQARTALHQAEAQLSVRRHALERARRELERCTILAPTDGIVISRNVDVGQTVAASLSAPVLFAIASDLDRMHIHANVSEADIGSVREGQAVRFQVDAHRGRALTGRVIQVRNAPQVVDNVVHYETIIAVANEEGLLKPGMTAEVSIVTAEVTGAIRVRNTALRARLPDAIRPPEPEGVGRSAPGQGSGRVYRLADGALVAVPVRTGLSDGLYTEILDGLAPGDRLVVGLAPPERSDGDRRSLFRGNQAQY